VEQQGEIFRRGMSLIWRYIRGEPRTFALAVLGATIFAASAVGTTVVLGKITDQVIIPAFKDDGVTSSAVLGAVAALLAVTVLRAVSIVLRRYFGAMTGRRTQRSLRQGVVDRYLMVPLGYHHATPTGKLLAHADADVEAATQVIYPLPFTVGVSALIFFSLISLLLVDPLLTLIALLLFPTLALLNRLYTTRVEEPAAVVQRQVGTVSTVAHESIDGALVVKLLGRERDESERLAAAADDLRVTRIEVGRLRAAFEPAIDAFPNVGIVLLLLLGTWEISTGRITTGELVQAMAIFGILAFPMRVVGFFLEELPRSVVSMDRIDAVLAEPSAPAPHPDDSRALPSGPLSVRFRHVDFGYGAHDGEDPQAGGLVLDGFDAEVEPGEIVAIVGSTGAGKSTACELLIRTDDPWSGTVELGGVDLRTVDSQALTDAVALVFQESFLFAESLRDNIALGTAVEIDAVRDAARVARADEFIEALPEGYDTVVGERGVTLSGGQRQRVALARALVRRPRLLILDDATSAVDPLVESEILEGLRTALDTTTMIVAHRVSTIELADRVLYVDDGRLVATGTHDELLRLPEYEAIVRAYEQEAG
jgi:ABC-type multidrug transport system fused ATPase/permease subunit